MDTTTLVVIIFVVTAIVVAFLLSRRRPAQQQVVVNQPPQPQPQYPAGTPFGLVNMNGHPRTALNIDNAVRQGCEYTESVTPWGYHQQISQPGQHPRPIVRQDPPVTNNTFNYSEQNYYGGDRRPQQRTRDEAEGARQPQRRDGGQGQRGQGQQ